MRESVETGTPCSRSDTILGYKNRGYEKKDKLSLADVGSLDSFERSTTINAKLLSIHRLTIRETGAWEPFTITLSLCSLVRSHIDHNSLQVEQFRTSLPNTVQHQGASLVTCVLPAKQ